MTAPNVDAGFVPQGWTVHLTRNGGWVWAIENTVEDWDPATVLRVEFRSDAAELAADVTWLGTVDGRQIKWSMTATEVAEVISAAYDHASLVYSVPGGPTDLVWLRGGVRVH